MVLTTAYLLLPNGLCGVWTCYFLQLTIVIPFWEGTFFLSTISLLRNILVKAGENQNTKRIERRHKKIAYVTAILSVTYFSTIQFIYGPDGIIYRVSQFFQVHTVSHTVNYYIGGYRTPLLIRAPCDTSWAHNGHLW